MAENKQAQTVYQTVLKALDNRQWNYDRHDNDLTVTMGVSGDDLPMQLILEVDADRELVKLLSKLPLSFPEDKRLEGSIATNIININIADGSFDYKFDTGAIYFRQVSSFKNSLIGTGLIDYLIDCACWTIDEYNDKLLMMAKGLMTIQEFNDSFNK